MIFEQESISFKILDVFAFDQSNYKRYNCRRNFDALSFRYKADTVIEYSNKCIHFADNSIGFFPSDVDYTRIAKRDRMIVIHFKAFNYHSSDIEAFSPCDYEKYHLLFEEIMKIWNKKDVAYKHKASSVLNLIFAQLYKDNRNNTQSYSKIHNSVKYINENYLKKDFSITDAAKESFISETYFRKLFNLEYNTSPKQYVINLRIKHAASLIIAGYHSLNEISELCGYYDYKHFSTEFKKHTGVSPSKYTYNF